MENLENIVKHAEHIHYPNLRDAYVSISKDTFTDIRDMVEEHIPSAMDFTVKTYKNDTDPLCITMLTVSLSNSEWHKQDQFMHVYRNTSLNPNDVEKTISDMAVYYRTEVLKLK